MLVSASCLVRVFGGAPWELFCLQEVSVREVSECTRAHASSVTLANHEPQESLCFPPVRWGKGRPCAPAGVRE